MFNRPDFAVEGKAVEEVLFKLWPEEDFGKLPLYVSAEAFAEIVQAREFFRFDGAWPEPDRLSFPVICVYWSNLDRTKATVQITKVWTRAIKGAICDVFIWTKDLERIIA